MKWNACWLNWKRGPNRLPPTNRSNRIMGAKLVAATPLLHSPDILWTGFDILRELPSGRLYALEANAIEYVWKFHSRQVTDDGFSVDEQFDGLRRAAYMLVK